MTGIYEVGLIVGDSFGNQAGEYPDLLFWPNQNNCVGGENIIDHFEPGWSTTLSNRPTGSTWAIIQTSGSAVNEGYTTSQIGDAITSMVSAASAVGLQTIVVGPAPYGGAAVWTSEIQTELDNYMAWLAANDTVVGFTHVEIYSALEDDISADNLEADYDSGDGRHPNAAGSAVIADQINTALATLGLRGSSVSNVVNLWRGAVEPLGAGGSGNEVRSWRGASEPIYTPDAVNASASNVSYAVQGIIGVDAHGTKVRSSIEFRLGTAIRANNDDTLIYVYANEDITADASVALGASFTASAAVGGPFVASYAIGSGQYGWVRSIDIGV